MNLLPSTSSRTRLALISAAVIFVAAAAWTQLAVRQPSASAIGLLGQAASIAPNDLTLATAALPTLVIDELQ